MRSTENTAMNSAQKLDAKIAVANLSLWYGGFQALHDINIAIAAREVTAFIGPSGCGKSTFLRSLNRMNDLIEGVVVKGEVLIDGQDIYD